MENKQIHTHLHTHTTYEQYAIYEISKENVKFTNKKKNTYLK